jgi:hypothetical protein
VVAFDRRLRFDGHGSGGTNMQTKALRTLVVLSAAATFTLAVALPANALSLNVIGGNGANGAEPKERPAWLGDRWLADRAGRGIGGNHDPQ